MQAVRSFVDEWRRANVAPSYRKGPLTDYMETTIKSLKTQRGALLADLSRIDAALAALTGGAAAAKPAAKKTTGRKRRKLTAEERRAISARMKKSWASRKRKAKQAAKG